MKSTSKENEEAIKMVTEKLSKNTEELLKTYQEEHQKRLEIKKIEEKYEEALEKQKLLFQEEVEEKILSKSHFLNELNNQLREAMEKDDRQLMQEILKKMSQL